MMKIASKTTIPIRAPKDIMKRLRKKSPGTKDADLIRLTYNFSLMKADIALDKLFGQQPINLKNGKKKKFK